MSEVIVSLTDLKGPALLYVSDDGVARILDRMTPVGEPIEGVQQMSQRDMNILMALWETFYPRWRQR